MFFCFRAVGAQGLTAALLFRFRGPRVLACRVWACGPVKAQRFRVLGLHLSSILFEDTMVPIIE